MQTLEKLQATLLGTYTEAWEGTSLPWVGAELELAQTICLQIGVLTPCEESHQTPCTQTGGRKN